jgi:hypothetical protein
MQGMSKFLSELFAILKTTEVEIKKDHTLLMANKTVSHKKSSKKGQGNDGRPKGNGETFATTPKASKSAPKPGVECFYCKGNGQWKRNFPKYMQDKKADKIAGKDKGIFDILVIDFYLTSSRSNT